MQTVLVVDDEPGITRYVELSLSSAGYTVITAASATEAINVFCVQHSRIDLVLSDIIMPGDMDGLMMTRAMRTLNPQVKLLFMSSQVRGLPEDLADTCGQVPKPFSPTQIVKAVHQSLDLDVRKTESTQL